MPDLSPENRMLPGAVARSAPVEPSPSETISLSQMFGVLRRRYRLVLAMTLLGTAAGGVLAYFEPPTFRAAAVLRYAGERRELTGGIETPTPDLSRTTDPLLSLAQLVRSRSVIGSVVDSLGLQLQSVAPELPHNMLTNIHIDPRVSGDSIVLRFSPQQVTARYSSREVTAKYGEALPLGAVRFTVTSAPLVPTAVVYVTPREVAIDNLATGIVVAPRSSTDIIDVTYVSTSPQFAQQVVNLTIKVFQTLNIQSAQEKSRRRREFLEEQFARTDSQLTQAQAELSSFHSRQQLASSQNSLDATQTALLALDGRRAELQADRGTFQSLLKQMRAGSEAEKSEAVRALAANPALGSNPGVNALYQQLNTFQYRLDSMTTGPFPAAQSNPDVVQMKGLMSTTQDQLTQALAAHVGALDAQIASLSALRNQRGQAIQVLPAMAEQESRLNQRVQSLSNVSDKIRQDYQSARMAEAVEAGDVDIVDFADLPYAPVWTAASIKLALGLFLGLLLGGGLAFLLDALNTSIRRPEDLEAALHLPGLAVIPRLTPGAPSSRPRLPGGKKPNKRAQALGNTAAAIGTVAQPFSIGTEAFRMLRTSLIWSDGADQLKTLVVTSAAPGEGKTLTAANLAASFSHDGLRVLLVDCDVRRPKLHGLFKLPRSPGLLDLLAPPNAGGSATVSSLTYEPGHPGAQHLLDQVVRETPIRGLSLLTCGALPTSASNLLSGVRMRALLAELTNRFDLVILDTPPVLATADAGILGSLADGVLLVVRAGQTDRAAAQRAYHQLVNVGSRVIGSVLNDPQGTVAQYGDYYYPYDYAAERE